MAPEKLVGKLGAQFFNDGDGGLVVVGFGQQGLYDRMQSTRAMRSARQKAKLMCQASIKDLVSENLLGEEMRDQNEGFFQTSDGEVTRFNADKWQSNIKSTASSLKINPLSIRSWEAKHPITGKTLVGEIMILAETKNIDLDGSNYINKSTQQVVNPEKEASHKKEIQEGEYIESEDLEGEDW